ncbi:MAG: glycosyltransferase family 2 protein [Alphaproteobacteria bacterium]
MLSVVMPAYNEADIIAANVRDWYVGVVAPLDDAELIVVDDCSRDATGAILDDLARECPGLVVVHLPRNVGHGPALRTGLLRARGDWVFHTDSDGQHRVTDFWSLWERRDAFDFVCGIRSVRADGPVRWVVSTGLRLANLGLWQRWVPDANCPFKLMRREPMRDALAFTARDDFAPMTSIEVLARRLGCRVDHVPVPQLPRRGGSPSLASVRRLARVAWLCAGQQIAVRRRWGRGERLAADDAG